MRDAFGHPRTILVLGGSSDIADETVRQFAGLGLERAVLAVRDVDALTARLDRRPLPLDAVQIEKWDATNYEIRPLTTVIRESFEWKETYATGTILFAPGSQSPLSGSSAEPGRASR